MNRLTGKDELGYYAPLECTLNCLKSRGILVDRLAEYEDTGLSPEDIRELRKLVDFDQLKELLKAKAEGRLAVLPCKVGDTVYQIGGVRLYQSAVESITIAERIYFDASAIYFDESAIGTSVFLSREEAEAALKAKEETDHDKTKL